MYVPSQLPGNLILSDFILKVSSLPPVFQAKYFEENGEGLSGRSWKMPGYPGLQCGHKYPPISGLMASALCPPWPGSADVLTTISCRNDRQRSAGTEEGPLRALPLWCNSLYHWSSGFPLTWNLDTQLWCPREDEKQPPPQVLCRICLPWINSRQNDKPETSTGSKLQPKNVTGSQSWPTCH